MEGLEGTQQEIEHQWPYCRQRHVPGGEEGQSAVAHTVTASGLKQGDTQEVRQEHI